METQVLGMHIFLDCSMFDSLFGIYCSRFSTFSKTPWLVYFDIPFNQARKSIAMESFEPLYSSLGSKICSFVARVSAYIMVTTLLPSARSLFTLIQRDTLFTYILFALRKIKLSSFIINFLIEDS